MAFWQILLFEGLPPHLHMRDFQFIPSGNENFPLQKVIVPKS